MLLMDLKGKALSDVTSTPTPKGDPYIMSGRSPMPPGSNNVGKLFSPSMWAQTPPVRGPEFRNSASHHPAVVGSTTITAAASSHAMAAPGNHYGGSAGGVSITDALSPSLWLNGSMNVMGSGMTPMLDPLSPNWLRTPELDHTGGASVPQSLRSTAAAPSKPDNRKNAIRKEFISVLSPVSGEEGAVSTRSPKSSPPEATTAFAPKPNTLSQLAYSERGQKDGGVCAPSAAENVRSHQLATVSTAGHSGAAHTLESFVSIGAAAPGSSANAQRVANAAPATASTVPAMLAMYPPHNPAVSYSPMAYPMARHQPMPYPLVPAHVQAVPTPSPPLAAMHFYVPTAQGKYELMYQPYESMMHSQARMMYPYEACMAPPQMMSSKEEAVPDVASRVPAKVIAPKEAGPGEMEVLDKRKLKQIRSRDAAARQRRRQKDMQTNLEQRNAQLRRKVMQLTRWNERLRVELSSTAPAPAER